MMSYYSLIYCVLSFVSLRVHGNLLETLRKLDRNQLPQPSDVTHNDSQGFLMRSTSMVSRNGDRIIAPTLQEILAIYYEIVRLAFLVQALDVVWFKPPDLLFQSSLYASTGALFFRNRVYPSDENRKNDYKLLRELFERRGVAVNAAALARAHGVSFFWRYIASTFTEEPEVHQVSDIQDSSIMLIDRARNAAMLDVLSELLPSFDIGYGDKEIFWVAATLAGANFVFEPFLAAQYADCYGMILHYDPDDAAGSPLYVNAEYMVERDISLVGQFLSPAMTPPILVTADMALVPSMDTWPGGKGRGDRGCTCRSFPCPRNGPPALCAVDNPLQAPDSAKFRRGY